MSIGLKAYYKHKQPSKEMKEIWKKNGSLKDYQKKMILQLINNKKV